MKFIIDFYKNLDPLNLIIFWGIIIVIILLLIFSFILINKNKKLKKIVENKITRGKDDKSEAFGVYKTVNKIIRAIAIFRIIKNCIKDY